MTLIPFIVIIIEYILYAAFTVATNRGVQWPYLFIIVAALVICLFVCVWSLINCIKSIRYRMTRVSAIFGTVMSASGITSAIVLLPLTLYTLIGLANGSIVIDPVFY